LSSADPLQKNTRSITKLALPSVSEYLVGTGLDGSDKSKLKESTIIIRSLLIEEWWEKDRSHKLFLILKSPVIIRRLLTFTSVSLRYFKAEWEELE